MHLPTTCISGWCRRNHPAAPPCPATLVLVALGLFWLVETLPPLDRATHRWSWRGSPAPPATVTDRLEAGSETIPLECPGQPAEDARGWWQLQRNLHQTLFTNSHVTYSATIGGVLRPTSSEGGRIQRRVKRGDSKRHVLGVELQRSV